MKKIKECSDLSWKGFEITEISSLLQIKGGMAGTTTTKGATYKAKEGGGSFDDGQDDSQHEQMP